MASRKRTILRIVTFNKGRRSVGIGIGIGTRSFLMEPDAHADGAATQGLVQRAFQPLGHVSECDLHLKRGTVLLEIKVNFQPFTVRAHEEDIKGLMTSGIIQSSVWLDHFPVFKELDKSVKVSLTARTIPQKPSSFERFARTKIATISPAYVPVSSSQKSLLFSAVPFDFSLVLENDV